MENSRNISIIGAGSFGTALAIVLHNKGHRVTLWARRAEQIEDLIRFSENKVYLPEVKIPKGVFFSNDLSSTVNTADIVVFAVPAQQFRKVFALASPELPKNAIVVNLAKGIEKDSLLRLSQIAEEINPEVRYVALSGPSHAEELAMNLPTTVTVASKKADFAEEIQNAFMTERFRIYTNEDMVGVELGGALKNIIALGAGISDGMGFGDNAKAAMMTRGITEISRLGLVSGARLATFSGLAGIGDLIVTCTSMHSRNRRCGILMGQGMKPSEAVKEVGMVVEGISTAEAAYALAKDKNIEMPITECIYKLINNELDPKEAVELLMGREKKDEMYII